MTPPPIPKKAKEESMRRERQMQLDAEYIKNHMPKLTFHQVTLEDGRTVTITDNYGFVAKSEYENFYNENFGEEAAQRLDRKIAHDNLLAQLILKTMKAPTQKQLQWIMASAANDEYKIFAFIIWTKINIIKVIYIIKKHPIN